MIKKHTTIPFISLVILFHMMLSSALSASSRIERLHSSATGSSYWLYTYLPDDYDMSQKRYNVVYLLDGDLHFDRIVENIRAREADSPASGIIIAGIGYGNEVNTRWRDFTPSRMHEFPGSGEVSRFYRFIRKELIPHIDRNYRTVRRPEGRCIAGHSFGGIASYYGLLFHHDFFGRYIVISPSLWWDGELFFRKRMRFHPRGMKRPLKIYCAVGSLEDPSMDTLAVKYLRMLKRRHPGRFISKYVVLNGRDHDDVVIEALAGGLDFMYQ